MPEDEPKWRRRKEARPAEIVDAALEVFAEKDFAAAKLDEIARKAGISKATLYFISTLRKRSSAPLRNQRSRRSLKRSKASLTEPTRRSPSSRPSFCCARLR
jgi:DNA-binding transcriptional regulator YbjK